MSLNLSVLSTPAAKAEAAKAKTRVEARILTELCWLVGVGLRSVDVVREEMGIMRCAFE